jgi:hypothetical protein
MVDVVNQSGKVINKSKGFLLLFVEGAGGGGTEEGEESFSLNTAKKQKCCIRFGSVR